MHDVFEPDIQAALDEFLGVMRMCIDSTSDADAHADIPDPTPELKQKVIEAVCTFEKVFPDSELARIVHIMVHLPDAIHRWNNIRNFWSFWGER